MKGISTALCAAITIDAGSEAPEWLHLLPAGEARTHDGRGPYRIPDAAALMASSMAAGKLALDENHATDLAAPKGLSAPARGWIVEMQNRSDGIWGRVEWTAQGRDLVAGYRGVSPVIAHTKDGTVTGILRASLTNTPNLAGLQSLHSEEHTMDFRTMLIGLLGLDGEADDAAIAAAVDAMKKKEPVDVPAALQSALAPIAAAAGVPETADAAAVLVGVQRLKAGGDDRVVSLQAEVATVTLALNAVQEGRARDAAVAFVDGAILAGRVGVKPVRDEYIAMHMKDPARALKLVNAMPVVQPGATVIGVVNTTDGTLTSPTLLAQKAGAYQAKLASGGVTISFAAAVRDVSEGKAA